MRKIVFFFSMALISITLSAQTTATVDGIKYILSGNTAAVTYPNSSEPGTSEYTGDIVIPPTITVDEVTYNVTAIGMKAFRKAAITSISLPEGLVSIGKEAIYNTKITEITVPNSVTTLEKYAIGQNSLLKKITFGKHNSDNPWGEWVAWRSSGGYEVYMICDAMPKLADKYTFDDTNASTIYVQPDVFNDYKADQYWSAYNIVKQGTELTDFTADGIKYKMVSEDKVVVTYPNDAEPGTSEYTGDIVIPAQVTYENKTFQVTGIADKAFRKAAITSVSLPEGLLTIGEEAFYKTQIAEITVPNSVTTLGIQAFAYCPNLKTIRLGEHIADNPWGYWTFYGETGPYNVYIDCHAKPSLPDEWTFDSGFASAIHVYSDVYDAFVADSKWGGSYNNIVPDMGGGSVPFIDFTVEGIKYKMTAEDKVCVTYPTNGKPGSDNPNTYTGDITIPAQVTYESQTYNVTSIGEYAFRHSGITSITLPEGLVSIGKEAIYNTKITEITLPNSVTNLGESCISQNSQLKTITVGGNIAQNKWGSWVFWRSSGGYDVYMICDAMPKLADNQTFDDSHESTIHVYPKLYLNYKNNYYWGCHNIVADLQQNISHEELQDYIATYSAKMPVAEETGTDPGFFAPASVQTLSDAIAYASSLDENATMAERNKAYLGLIMGADELQINPLNEGYYYIENVNNNKYIRTGSDSYLAVKTFDGTDARFSFRLIRKGSNWYVQAADENRKCFGAPDGENWVNSTGDTEYEQIITWVKGGIYKIQCLNNGTASNLYGQSQGYVFVSSDYTDDNTRAQWRFHPVQSGTFAQDFNIENIRVREYMADVTYTKEDASKIENYNIAPPARRDTPEPATIFWTRNENATAQYITWSTNADFAHATPVETGDKAYFEIYNLIPGQTYYYKVTATVDGNTTEIVNSSFTTSGQLRQIKAEGGANIRDLGGWTTASGKTIRYGLIYRGAEWNGKYNLTPEGIAAIRATGIRAELDLRSSNEALYIDKSPVGDDVTYIRIHNEDYYESGMQNRKDLYKKNLQFVFDCLKNDKPVFFHCHIGADRTGTLAFLLEGLLGVSESDLYKDYELTSFSYLDTERHKENIDGLLEYVNTLDGETLTDKFYTYCHKELGFSAKEIADFRMKMLGVVYPADIKNIISEAVSNKATSLNLSNLNFGAEALTENMPNGTNLLVTVSPESGISGTNIISNGVCENLVLTDGADFGAAEDFTATQVSYTTNVSTCKTLVLPFEAAVPAGFKASGATSVTGNLVNLEETQTIKAGQPVLIEGTGKFELTVSGAAIAATGNAGLTDGVLCGTYKSIPAPVDSYVLQNQSGVIGFYQVDNVQPAVSAFRAYLTVPASGVKAFYLNEEATGIESVNGNTCNMEVYNLAGQRLNRIQKGINIINGQKVLK